MADLPWNQEIIDWFASNRVDWLTQIMVVFTFLGNELGYILIIVSIYWLYDKRLAVKLVMAVILTTLINHSLKILIRNPRPYVNDLSYRENWAIPEGDIEETAHSFSTPSGHAQGSMTFWLYLHLKVKSRPTFVLFPVMFLLIGLSRPYLGVHYLEDIFLGWFVGFLVVVFLERYDERIATWWNTQSAVLKYIIIFVIPIVTFTIAGFLSDFTADGENYATLGGIFSGISFSWLVEKHWVNFSPSFSSDSNTGQKLIVAILRFIIGAITVLIFLEGLDMVFGVISDDDSLLGFILRWIRYASVSFAGIIIAPYIFVKTRLANLELDE